MIHLALTQTYHYVCRKINSYLSGAVYFTCLCISLRLSVTRTTLNRRAVGLLVASLSTVVLIPLSGQSK